MDTVRKQCLERLLIKLEYQFLKIFIMTAINYKSYKIIMT